MRKTLLIAGAALAASIISSQAQVYSQNIVGYVNIPAIKGFNNIANPLDCGNSLTNVVPPGSTWDFTSVSIWTGSGYTSYTIDSSMTTGVADAGDNFAVTAPTIKPGMAFFFNNNSGSSNTLTIAGTVHVDAPATGLQTVGTATNSLGTVPQLNFYGSVIPVAGELGSIGFPTNGPADYTTVQIPNISAGGSITGFTAYTVDSTLGGWADAGDNFAVPGPVLPVGKGFFFANNTGHVVNWIQSY
jgi:hypothetical protein